MAFSDPVFEKRRATFGGGSQGSTQKTTNSGSSFVDPVFEKRRMEIISTPSQPTKKQTTAPVTVSQPKKQNLVERTTDNLAWAGNTALDNAANLVKKIGNFTVKLVTPKPTAMQQEVAKLTQAPIKLSPDQKKLTTEQLQQVAVPSASLKQQSKQESLKKAQEIRKTTSEKIRALEKVFDSQVVKQREVKKGYKEPGIVGGMIEEIKLGTVSTLGNMAAGLEMEGRAMQANPYDIRSIAQKFLMTNVGRKLSAEADNIIASNPEWMADPNEGWSARKIARLGAGAAPSILINIAATLVTAPIGGVGGYASGYLMEGGATYKEAKKMGVSEEKAQFYGRTVGVVNSIFEHIMPGSMSFGKKVTKEVLKEGTEQISKSLAKDALKSLGRFGLKMAKNGILEGSTEGIQEMWSNVIAKNYDKNRKPWDNVIESIVGGFIGGGVAGGGSEEAIQRTGIIPDGTYTPEQVIGKLIQTKMNETTEGKELMKTALQAKETGQQIEVKNEAIVSKEEEVKGPVEEKVFYRGGGEGSMPKGTAADIIAYEQNELGNTDITVEKGINLKKLDTKNLEWLTETKEDAEQYGEATERKLKEGTYRIIARDKNGGILIEKNITPQVTKKSAKEYVEKKVKQRSVKFRESEIKNPASSVISYIDKNGRKVYTRLSQEELSILRDEINKIPEPPVGEKQIHLDAITGNLTSKATEISRDEFIAGHSQAKQVLMGDKTGPKFREMDTDKQLEELLAIERPNLEQIKLINKLRGEQRAQKQVKSAEDIGEEKMGWKPGQKDAFDNAVSRKDTATVKEMLKDVPEYYKTEFKTQIDEALSPARQYVAEKIENRSEKFRDVPDAKTVKQEVLEYQKAAMPVVKGITKADLITQDVVINMKRDVPVTDIYGNKDVLPKGEALTPYILKGNKVLLKDGKTYVVSKNQYQNIRGQALKLEAKEFAPELKQTEETVKGAKFDVDIYNNYVKDLKAKYDPSGRLNMSMLYDELSDVEKAKFDAMKKTQDESRVSSTKYSQYTLPGGENYKEILIRAPRSKDFSPNKAAEITKKAFADFDAGIITREERNKLLDETNKYTDDKYFQSSHWSEPNVISHLRINERTYNGEKVAFMEELQSDWAREGRSKGFATEITKDTAKQQGFTVDKKKTHMGDEAYFIDNQSDPYMYRKGFPNIGFPTEESAWNALVDKLKTSSNAIPNNPLLKNWQELTIKRALKEAVDSGAEYFAWINGDQTSNRYSLSTHLDDVSWRSNTTTSLNKQYGIKEITLQPKESSTPLEIKINNKGMIVEAIKSEWQGKKLDEVLGKGLADKIMADDKGTLSGEGLKFGGEWANTLYDRQVGNIVRDLTGAKIEEIDMGLPVEGKLEKWYNVENGMITPGNFLKPEQIKVGKEIQGSRGIYIITKTLGNGKFRAVLEDYFIERKSRTGETTAQIVDKISKTNIGETFDLSTKTSYQQAIKLTPEVKAIVKGEAVTLKQPSGLDPFEEYAKFRVRDDVKKMTGRTITDAQEQELIDLNRKFFGDDKVNITLQIMANSKALGQYYENMIDIVDGQADPKATYLHEAVHKYLDVFSTTEEYVQVLEEGAKKYKTDDYAEVEEKIAEEFITYAKTKESANTGIKGFFTKILNRIKLYFANKSAIERLYNQIIEGKAVKKATEQMEVNEKPLVFDAIPANEEAQTPVGKGDKAKSKAYTRIFDRLAEETRQDVSYNKLNIEKDVEAASEFAANNPKAAIRVALGLEEAPAGQTETAISIVLADKAGRDGDFALQSQLEAARSLRQTRRGQEIVSERGRFNEDSPHFFIRKLLDARLNNLGKSLGVAIEEYRLRLVSAKEVAIKKIDKVKKSITEKIKADRKKIDFAKDFLSSITCK